MHFHIIRNSNNPVNSMVIPYRTILSRKYIRYINVEYCVSIRSLKYIFDCIHEDRVCCKIDENGTIQELNQNDEVYDELSTFIVKRGGLIL